jgi:hypothetical protein
MKTINKIISFFYNPIIKAYYKNGVMYVEKKYSNHEYKGSATVWYNGIYRCSTTTEYVLSGLWNYCKNGDVYKNNK